MIYSFHVAVFLSNISLSLSLYIYIYILKQWKITSAYIRIGSKADKVSFGCLKMKKDLTLTWGGNLPPKLHWWSMARTSKRLRHLKWMGNHVICQSKSGVTLWKQLIWKVKSKTRKFRAYFCCREYFFYFLKENYFLLSYIQKSRNYF